MAEFIQKTLKKEGVDYYITHLQLINPLMEKQLAPMEIIVLANFMFIDSEIARVDRFHREVRKEVKRKLELSNGGLSNYLRSFKEKEFIKEGINGVLYIKEYLFPENEKQFYQYKLLKEK